MRNHEIYEYIEAHRRVGGAGGLRALLIDPDRWRAQTLADMVRGGHVPDLVLLGGSLVSADVAQVLRDVRCILGAAAGKSVPVLLFPGDPCQVCAEADAVLLLSLVSGRNAEYLIGRQVVAAPLLRRLELETIATAYILVDGGRRTAVQYVSATNPLPGDKPELAVATAMAAEMLGFQALYLEAGSGAVQPVSAALIRAVREAVEIPIIVGGGITSRKLQERALRAGADVVVVGTALESAPSLASELFGPNGERND